MLNDWNGPSRVDDGATDYGWYWSKDVEYKGTQCTLVASIYDEEGIAADLIVYHPEGNESFPCYRLNDLSAKYPTDVELFLEWADDMWDKFVVDYGYIFD